MFDTPFKVKVSDANNAPIANKIVFARIVSGNGDIYPFGYEPLNKGVVSKYLSKPIPGVYHIDSGNPLVHQSMLLPLLTDSNGEIEFKEMSFNVAGEAGTYTIMFECEKAQLLSPPITVMTSVAAVKFYAEPVSYINTD